MQPKIHTIEDKHKLFHDDVISVLKKHCSRLSVQEMLAVTSHLVGQLIVLQDQRTITPDMAMQIVIKNIEQGNREAVLPLLSPLTKN